MYIIIITPYGFQAHDVKQNEPGQSTGGEVGEEAGPSL